MARLLTESEFRKRRPNGSYERYLRWILKHGSPEMKRLARAAINARGGGGGGGGVRSGVSGGASTRPWLFGRPLTYEEMQRLAESEAEAALAPSRDEINRQIAQTIAEARAQGKSIKEITASMMPFLQSVGPSVQEAYQSAAGAIAGSAAGFSGEARRVAEETAEDVRDALARRGLPQESIDAAGQVASDAGAADVLYGMSGYIPGEAMGHEGAAAAAYGARLPSVFASIGKQDALALERQAAEISKGLRQQLIDLQARFPGLKAEALARLMESEIARESARIDRQRLKLAKRAMGLDVRRQKFEEQKWRDELDLEREKLRDEKEEEREKEKEERSVLVNRRNKALDEMRERITIFVMNIIKPINDPSQSQPTSIFDVSLPDEDGGSGGTGKDLTRDQIVDLIMRKFGVDLQDMKRRYAIKQERITQLVNTAITLAYHRAFGTLGPAR